MPPKKLRPSKWRSLEGGGVDDVGSGVVFTAVVLVDTVVDVVAIGVLVVGGGIVVVVVVVVDLVIGEGVGVVVLGVIDVLEVVMDVVVDSVVVSFDGVAVVVSFLVVVNGDSVIKLLVVNACNLDIGVHFSRK